MTKAHAGQRGQGAGTLAPRWIKGRGVAIAALVALGLGGCAQVPTTQVASLRSPDYKAHIERIFVIYDGEMRYGAEFANGFREEMTQRLASCDVQVEFGVIKSLMVDTAPVEYEFRRFRPDVSLRVQNNGGVVYATGAPMRADFLLTLTDVDRNASVWRGDFKVHQAPVTVTKRESGGVFATDLVNRLITDRLIDRCPVLSLDPGNRLPQRSVVTSGSGQPAQVPPAKPVPAPQAGQTANASPPIDADKTRAAAGKPATPAAPGVAEPVPSQAKVPVAPPAKSASPVTPQAAAPKLPTVSLDDLPMIAAAPVAVPPSPQAPQKPAAKAVEPLPGPKADAPVYRRDLGTRIDDLSGLLPAQ